MPRGRISMKKLGVFLGALVFGLCLMPFGGVHAEEYDDTTAAAILGGTPQTFKAGDTFTAFGYDLIGEDGYINITEGTVTVAKEGNGITMTVDGTAETRHMKNLMFVSYGDTSLPINMVVNEGAVFNLYGNMALTTGTPTTFTNNGTVNIVGNLEVRSASTYTGTGVTNLYGNISLYGESGLQVKVNMFEHANVYSTIVDVKDNLVVAQADTDEFTYALGENDKKHTSISGDAVSSDFAYGYTLVKTAVETDEPTEDVKDEVKDEAENPKTSDGIMITVAVLAASAVIAVIARKKLA